MPYAQSASWRLVAEINRHRRLANYQYIGLHERDEVWDEARDENEYLTGVRHLQFSLHDRQMCEQAGNVLTCMRNVTRLDVEGHRSASDETNLVTWQLILRMFSVEHELPHLRTLRLKGLRLLHNDGIVPQPPGLRAPTADPLLRLRSFFGDAGGNVADAEVLYIVRRAS